MKIYKIGNLKLKNPYFLAPMHEINDIAFRLLCKKAGAGLTFTGMTHPKDIRDINLEDKPALQLFCSSSEGIKSFIKKFEKKVSMFDFNLGCPANKARKQGYGVFLHDKYDIIEEILKTIRKSTNKPLSIKIRKSEYSEKIVILAEKYCDAIIIHPRTEQQGYSGKADIDFAMNIKNKVKIPVIYSGDVDETNANYLLKKFDFVMIGRKAIGNPNIFSNLLGKKAKIGFSDYLKLAIKYKIYFRQIKFQAINFTKGIQNAKELRFKIINAKNIEDLKKIMLIS